MKEKKIVIIGGGLAGLTAAIHLSLKGFRVRLFEKEDYPHHKVCGEYLSNEILPYLNSLGVVLDSLKPVEIDKLVYSTSSGKAINAKLPLGGIGISRYALDNFLYKVAKSQGVEVIQEEVLSVSIENDNHKITTSSNTYAAKLVLGAYGKRSILDKRLQREFIEKKTGWLAVKAHYKLKDYPEDTVSLHNFPGGYCGLSKTETGAVNVCYLTTYKSFKKHKDPNTFKDKVLSENNYLGEFFKQAESDFEKDITIAQISFDKKSRIEDHIIMLGDAAALIHPLCGNGMAMAIHSAKIASEKIEEHFISNDFNRKLLEKEYTEEWNRHFRSRLITGRILQKILLNPSLAEASQHTVQLFPFLLPQIIKRTHGRPVI